MAVTVKKVTLWRAEVQNKPGALSTVLGPLAEAGTDLQVVMGYHYHGMPESAVIEVCPVSGKKATTAADKVGLKAVAMPTLLVQGDDKPGLGHAIAQAIAEAGINITFLVAQVIGTQFSAVIGLPDEAASKQAVTLIEKAVKQIEKYALHRCGSSSGTVRCGCGARSSAPWRIFSPTSPLCRSARTRRGCGASSRSWPPSPWNGSATIRTRVWACWPSTATASSGMLIATRICGGYCRSRSEARSTSTSWRFGP